MWPNAIGLLLAAALASTMPETGVMAADLAEAREGRPLEQTDTSAIGAARASELEHLIVQDCGSCHGMTLKGGLGLPLTPGRMAAWSEADLAHLILEGVPGTPMPGWAPLLTPDEARWIANRLRERGADER